VQTSPRHSSPRKPHANSDGKAAQHQPARHQQLGMVHVRAPTPLQEEARGTRLSVWPKNLLKFGNGNAKLAEGIYHFSLLSGHTCPFASECLAKVNLSTGKVIDGPNTKFRCYSAMMEAMFPTVRRQREHNTNLLKGKTFDEMVETINNSLPIHAKYIRVHIGGDFFNQTYFDAWMEIARRNPSIVFYSYTKSLSFWVARLDKIPSNYRLTASKGGRQDELIEKHDLRFAEVVFSESEANIRGLTIDHDDSHAYSEDPKSFALLIHGSQPKGTEAAKSLALLKKSGWSGYGKGNLLTK